MVGVKRVKGHRTQSRGDTAYVETKYLIHCVCMSASDDHCSFYLEQSEVGYLRKKKKLNNIGFHKPLVSQLPTSRLDMPHFSAQWRISDLPITTMQCTCRADRFSDSRQQDFSS